MLLSSGDSFPHLIQKRSSQLGFATYLLNYPRSSYHPTKFKCGVGIPVDPIHHHHHHHVHEGLGMFPVPWSSRWNWSLHLFLGRPMFLRSFDLYSNACFGILFVSILCTCCSHFYWYCFISFTIFCAPVFPPIHWFFSLSCFVIPSKCLRKCI
jgi:hypothetical protein